MKRNPVKGNLLLLIAAAVWGFAFAAQDAAGKQLGVFTINSLRFLIASLMLTLLLPLLDRAQGTGRRLMVRTRTGKLRPDVHRTELLAGVLCGFLLFVAAGVQQLGISEGTGAGKAAFLTALYIVFVPLFSMVFRRRPGRFVWISLLPALCGAYLLTAVQGSLPEQGCPVLGFFRTVFSSVMTPVPSDLLVLCSAVAFAMQIVAVDRFIDRVDGVRLAILEFAVAGLLALPAALFAERPAPSAVLAAALPLLYLGIFSGGVGYTFQILGQQHTAAAPAALLMSLESVFGVLGGVLLVGERLSVFEITGCLLLFGAVLLSQVPDRKKNIPPIPGRTEPAGTDRPSVGTTGFSDPEYK